MTLDEAIKHAEEIAEEQESRGYCDRSVCVIMDENNHNCDECEVVKCRECAEEHRQLAGWLKELQAHRKAWMKVVSEVDQHTEIHSDGEFYVKNFDVKKIVAEYRPKDGDTKLEQQHCDDAISRENTLKAMIEQLGIRNEDYLLPAEATLYKVVKNMPPVTPQLKMQEVEKI